MERFQKIKTARKKLNVSLICRCCGLENEEKYNILQIFEDGVEFKDKYLNLVGVDVVRGDGMPQSICSICYDKINDFYEFRLMAQNTEKQTREALGLPRVEKKTIVPIPAPLRSAAKAPVDPKSAVVKLVDLRYSIEDKMLIQKAFQRISSMSFIKSEKKRSESPAPSTVQPPPKKARKDINCKICSENFGYLTDLQDHQLKEHLPLISRYACGSCRETFEQLSDYKKHELKHSKEKMPYECFICLCSYAKLRDFTKHMTNFNCIHKEKLEVTVEDIRCGQCKKKFLTQNLFEWHPCFLKTRGSCAKCGMNFTKKKALFKHYITCEAQFVLPEWARDQAKKSIKSEVVSPNKAMHMGAIVKKKTQPARRMTAIKAERELNVPTTNEEDGELDDYDDNITYDNYGSDDDDYSHSTGFEPQIDLQEGQTEAPKIIDIKAEKSFEGESSIQFNGPLTVDHIRKVKREQIAKQQAIRIVTHRNPFAVKVKREAENRDQSAVKVLNPFSNSSHQSDSANTKKVFKIPQKLAMKIKKEKNQSSSVVVQNEIDEADADPEEEEQMQRMAASVVKVEKEAKKPLIVKHLINPLALAKAKTTESNSLIISAVSSIGEELNIPEERTPMSSQEPENNKMMTEIPAEFTKIIQYDEETCQQPPDSIIEEDSNNILSFVGNNQIEDVAVNNSNNDELDELLEKYGTSDIQDDDIQDLLKFD